MEPKVSNYKSRHSKRSSLKRSKSLHCPKAGSRYNGTVASSVKQPGVDHGKPQLYANRRHHSTNEYMAEYEDESLGCRYADYNIGLMLNTSSHSLYNQFQNDSFSQQHANSSSGASIISFCDGNKKDPFDDAFVDVNQAQLCRKLSLLSMSPNGMQHYSPSQLANSSSISSLFNGYCEANSLADCYQEEDNWEALSSYTALNRKLLKDKSDSSLSSRSGQQQKKQNKTGESDSNKKRLLLHRFYIIKQRNYPPLYLGNGLERRRIYRVLVLGFPSSGKTTLIEQFSACLDQCADAQFNPTNCAEISTPNNLLVHFLESDSFDKYLLRMPVTDYQPDAYLILYSVNNKDSFNSVKKTLIDLQRWDDVETKSIIIVANKSDLVRSRCVTKREGRELALDNNCKYIETSCTISHNIDVLLQGIGSQICLKEKQKQAQQVTNIDATSTGYKHKRKSSFFKRILRKTAISKSKSCDNLHVL